jgi:hypothetical protein
VVALRLCMTASTRRAKIDLSPSLLTSDPVGHGMTGRIGSTSKVARSLGIIAAESTQPLCRPHAGLHPLRSHVPCPHQHRSDRRQIARGGIGAFPWRCRAGHQRGGGLKRRAANFCCGQRLLSGAVISARPLWCGSHRKAVRTSAPRALSPLPRSWGSWCCTQSFVL